MGRSPQHSSTLSVPAFPSVFLPNHAKDSSKGSAPPFLDLADTTHYSWGAQDIEMCYIFEVIFFFLRIEFIYLFIFTFVVVFKSVSLCSSDYPGTL